MTKRPVGRPKTKVADARTEIVEAKCAKCGKTFCPAPYHVYKDGRKLYCSWTCFNHRKDKT